MSKDSPGQAESTAGRVCPDCATHFPSVELSCPRCHRLVHGDALKGLIADARAKQTVGDVPQALGLWREALDLLPGGSRQHALVLSNIEALTVRGGSTHTASTPADSTAQPPSKAGRWAGVWVVGLLLWKFKAVLAFALTKGKLLLAGLTKASTLWSMALAVGVYWTLWGWKFAVGFVVSIYVHEMGHVMALKRLGIAASAPMFVPGLGAFVRLKQYPASPAEDAEVGLAGPIWGLAAAVCCYLLYLATDYPLWAGLAKVGAWINLFNLMPVWQLDGGRGFQALSRRQRWIATGCIGLAWLWGEAGLVLVLLLVAAGRSAWGVAPEQPNRTALVSYCGLVLALAALAALPVPTGAVGLPG